MIEATKKIYTALNYNKIKVRLAKFFILLLTNYFSFICDYFINNKN